MLPNPSPALALALALGALLAHTARAAYELTNHPVISPEFDWDELTPQLVGALPKHPWSVDTWAAGYVPAYCESEAQRNAVDAADFRVVNVTYQDCSAVWVFCIHKDVKDSDYTIFDAFGQVPVGMRSYAANMIAMTTMSASPGAAAITNRYYTTVTDGYWNPGLLGHELSHQLDWQILGSDDYWSNNATEWQNAEKSDSALPTTYAQTNWIENFAEIGRLSLTNKNVEGGLAGVNANAGQIANQVDMYEGKLAAEIYPSGGQCVAKTPSSAAVAVGSSTSRRRGEKPPGVGVPAGIVARPLPEVWVDDVIEHGRGHSGH